MKLVLPLPPPELSPNARPHYMTKSLATAEYRNTAKEEAMIWCADNKNTFPWDSATIQLNFYFQRAGRRDPDNLLAWCKSAFDGLRDAGVLTDDDEITHLPVLRYKDKDNPRLEMEVMKTDMSYEQVAKYICKCWRDGEYYSKTVKPLLVEHPWLEDE